ncbi:hypothetical protein LFAB_11605 [Lactiplantibacillus fabifermentans T30PCM01]|uniref:Uncharacterized protein n=1 Tax=Lactiplantibacillus fabifermentans T30PCM01 TaxID=1400520 RepID=W6T626_9LACO|nr:hypothetical protein LFAB_11605 [Lactiplantibacillus fabifermentans T30PCM01]
MWRMRIWLTALGVISLLLLGALIIFYCAGYFIGGLW